jgi:predicted GIY-YIG superfamily endonuclease
MPFFTYLLRCADDALYAGYTRDLEARLALHAAGRASACTRARLPVRVAWVECFERQGDAMRREAELKSWPRARKEALIAGREASDALDAGEAALAPTWFLDRDHPQVATLAADLRRDTPRQTSVALFDWVRDHIAYVPLPPLEPGPFRASRVLAAGWGYCVQKAVLLAALGRASGIPSRLGFADVRNHQLPGPLRSAMGTNLFTWHGFTEFHLEGRWVKATPAFDTRTAARAGVLPVELDGANDALMHPVDPRGNPYIEYVAERGSYLDLPYDGIQGSIRSTYGEPVLRVAWEARARRAG